ncbi:MAG TPA: phosphatidate cytidylyltransferase [Hyphomicrobiaceae bacterium]|nr:phosphatidate cytidylyltransferase [Hyphomicrobiaceae bacterium]
MSEEAASRARALNGNASDPSKAPNSNAQAPKSTSDFKVRLIAGSVMALVALLLTYAGPRSFAVLVLGVALVMCWEWGRLVRGQEFGPALVIHMLAVVAAGVLSELDLPALGLAALMIGAIVLAFMPFGSRRLLSVAGVAYVGLPVVGMLWLRDDPSLGFEAVLFVFAIVWGSDIGAFVAGRGLGGPKLWPRVSPNKTWAGFFGGLTAGVLAGIIFAQFIAGTSSLVLALTGLVLAVAAQMGDLAESALKRHFGIKDSSTIIPGHGGVMDRADSIVAVSIVVSLLALLENAALPAHALFGL